MNCWHHKVTVTKAEPDDRYGDVVVDTDASYAAYLEWVAMAGKPDQTPGNLRRPLWFARACRPADSAYQVPDPTLGTIRTGTPDNRDI